MINCRLAKELTIQIPPNIIGKPFEMFIRSKCNQIDMGAKRMAANANVSTWWRHQMAIFSALLAFVRGIHQSPVNSPHKGQWSGALMFSLIFAWTNDWLGKQWWGWWFETPSYSLWRHCNYLFITLLNPGDSYMSQWTAIIGSPNTGSSLQMALGHLQPPCWFDRNHSVTLPQCLREVGRSSTRHFL